MDQNEPFFLKPENNPYLIGHEESESLIVNLYKKNKLNNTWLISGPSGMGKATLAYRMIRYIFAHDSLKTGSHNKDGHGPLYVDKNNEIFLKVSSSSHHNLLVINGSAGEDENFLTEKIKIEEIRKVNNFLHMTSGQKGYRIVFVDNIDLMNKNAGNALLKIIEEPPKKSLIVLTTSFPSRILPTIRSRSRIIKIKPLNSNNFSKVMDLANTNVDDGLLHYLYEVTSGSPGKAIDIIKNDGIEIHKKIKELIFNLTEDNTLAIQEVINTTPKERFDKQYISIFQLLSFFLNKALKFKFSVQTKSLIKEDEEKFYVNLLKKFNVPEILNIKEKIEELYAKSISLNLNKKQIILSSILLLKDSKKT